MTRPNRGAMLPLVVGMVVVVLCSWTEGTVAFSPSHVVTSSSSWLLPSSQRRNANRSGMRLHMVFERMSEPCVAALVYAQDEAGRLGFDEVSTTLTLAGIVDSPQNARRTLRKYGVPTGKRGASAIVRTIPTSSDNRITSQVFGRQRASRQVELPFSRELRRRLQDAGILADRLESAQVRPEHLLLSLLEVNTNDGNDGNVDGDLRASEDNEAVQALRQVVLSSSSSNEFSSVEFGRALLQDLRRLRLSGNEEDGEAELVGGGGSGNGDTPTLAEVTVDLTALAARGELDPVYGRDTELAAALRTLVRRRKNNPCLVGEPGVGKTAIAEGLAQILVAPTLWKKRMEEGWSDDTNDTDNDTDNDDDNDDDEPEWNVPTEYLRSLASRCPPSLSGHRVLSLEMADLVAGTKYRGEFEERLRGVVDELTSPETPPSILFLDEIHTLVGAGSAEGGIDAANILKPALARGKLQVIGATTIAEYRKYIEKDAALERRLQPLTVDEPSVARTLDILKELRNVYGTHHGVTYDDEALEACATLSERYVTDRFLPDKAIDLMDEAGAAVQLRSAAITMSSDRGVMASVPSTASVLLPSAPSSDKEEATTIVTEDDVYDIVAQWTGIPVGRLTKDESSRLLSLETDMAGRVVGQTQAVEAVARAVRRARSGLRDSGRPVASLLFCGPTGVGKTELCRVLAQTVYGRSQVDTMVRIDMSEYGASHSVSRLVGSPPGYVGYDEGGQLTEAVRRRPHSLVLLDELEKAHPDVLNVLLQIMEDGLLTDGKGRTVTFKNVILVMTSNVGSRQILEQANTHHNNHNNNDNNNDNNNNNDDEQDRDMYRAMSAVVAEELQSTMRPELLNRMDEVVVFRPLSTLDLEAIAKLLIRDTAQRATSERNLQLTVADSLVRYMVQVGAATSSVYGARPMRRTVQRCVEDPVGDALLRGFLTEGDDVTVDYVAPDFVGNGKVHLTRTRDGAVDVVALSEGGGIDAGNRAAQRYLQQTQDAAVPDPDDNDDEWTASVPSKKKKKKSSWSPPTEDEQDTQSVPG